MLSAVIPLLAAATPSPSPSPVGPPDPTKVSPGLLGLLSWIFLLIAVYFIWRSMSKQMKKISFADPEDASDRRRLPHRVPHAPVDGPEAAPSPRTATAWSPSPRTRPPRDRH